MKHHKCTACGHLVHNTCNFWVVDAEECITGPAEDWQEEEGHYECPECGAEDSFEEIPAVEARCELTIARTAFRARKRTSNPRGGTLATTPGKGELVMNKEVDAVINGDSEGCIVCGDCLEIMKDMPDGCVDAVVTDPPYGIGFPYHSYIDTRDSLEALVGSFVPLVKHAASRAAYILCGPTQIGLYPQPIWCLAITWNTTGTFGKYGYNQWTPVLCYGPDIKGFGNVNGTTKTDTLRISGGGGVGFARTPIEKEHTCPKPITVMDLVIQRLTNQPEIILDPFCGSGTTCVAAKKLGRRWIGIDIEPKYVEIAKSRVMNTERPLF